MDIDNVLTRVGNQDLLEAYRSKDRDKLRSELENAGIVLQTQLALVLTVIPRTGVKEFTGKNRSARIELLLTKLLPKAEPST